MTRRRGRWVTPAIRAFVRRFGVDLSEAERPDAARYATFNEFFTRALAPGAREIDRNPDTLASPADGAVSALGRIERGRLWQAKGVHYTLDTLLAGDREAADRLADGSFATIYLSPRDYHRLHMPVDGTLRSQTHVPGRLFGVAPPLVRSVPGLFARNERVIAQFDTERGLLVLVLVGAINVAAIETVWHGLVTPPRGRRVTRIDYPDDTRPRLSRGEEMGRFNMGSTVIVLAERPIEWQGGLRVEAPVRMGSALGRFA